MKRTTAVGASVAVAAATLLAYKLHQRRQANSPVPSPPTVDDRTLKDGVYELGAAEQSLGAMSIHNGMFRVAIRLRLQSRQPVQLSVLRQVLARLQARHPALRCTFHQEAIDPKPEPPLPAHKTCLREQRDVPLAIIEVPAAGNSAAALDAAWETCWAEVQHEPFALGASLMQLVVIQDKEPSTDSAVDHLTELGVVIEHGVSDGISATHVAHELLEQLALLSSSDDAPPDVESLPFKPTMEDIVPACGPLPPMPGPAPPSRFSSLLSRGRALIGLAPAAAPPAPPAVTHDHFDCVPLKDREDPVVTHTLYGHLSKQETRNLIANCRARKVTVTAAVVAAETAAAAEVLHSQRQSGKTAPAASSTAAEEDEELAGEAADGGDGGDETETVEVQASLAVDIRKLYKPEPYAGHHLGFHVSGMRPVSKHFNCATLPTPPSALWEHATTTRQSIVSGMAMSLVFVPFMGPALAGAATDPPADAPPTGPTVSVSSWGKLPFVETYGDFTLLSALPAVNCSNATPFPATLVSTTNDELTITAITGATLSLETVMEPLVEGTMRHLRAMAEVEAPRPEE